MIAIPTEFTADQWRSVLLLIGLAVALIAVAVALYFSARLRKAKEGAEQTKAQGVALLGGVSEGVVVVDGQGLITLINNKAADLLNVQAGQIVGQSVASCKLYDQNNALLKPEATPAWLAITTKQQAAAEVQSIFADGSKIALHIKAIPVTRNGILAGVVLVIYDVSGEKESDRMKTEFISLASHQLRTPLSAAKWFLEMMLAGDAGKLSNEQQEFIENINDSTERMISLIRLLLNVSRIESGRILVEPKPTDLKKMMEEIAAGIEAKLAENQQRFELKVHDDLTSVSVDPRLTREIYLNLLSNAMKYTPKGGEISVSIAIEGDEVVSRVIDNGYGIPEAQHGKVFQKFFRGENTSKMVTEGTGLGLYLVRALVDVQMGKIWFESDEGEGTTFLFSLPLAGVPARKGEVTIDATR